MFRRISLILLFTSIPLFPLITTAQVPCPLDSRGSDLICLIPQLYTPAGLTNPAFVNTGHEAHFQEASFENSNALNSSIGSQLTLLPIASPASGFVAVWNPSLGIYEQSSASFGPILSERSETIGRNKVHFGVSYQYFGFNRLDGIHLKNIPTVFKHIDEGPTCTNGATVPQFAICPPPNNVADGNPVFETEVVNTSSRIDLKIHQVTAFLTYGLTNRVDVSVAVPFENVRLSVTSAATIVPNSEPASGIFLHAFQATPDCASPVLATSFATSPPSTIPGCLDATFARSGSASGIGDVTFRVKSNVWRAERNGIALGMDIRVPTGDEKNFLGSGTVGLKPFIAWSYRARIAPHVNFGYEWNGKSILGGTVIPGQQPTEGNLPREILYSAGFDAGITKGLTFAFDFLGQHLFNTSRVSVVNFNRPSFNCPTVTSTTGCPDLQQTRGTVNIKNAALGLKFSPISRLLVTADVLLPLDDGGLRAKAVPLIGLSYLF